MSYYHDSIMIEDTLRLKKEFDCDIFIETGTDKGESIRILKPYFSKIYSCEIESQRWQYYDDLLVDNNIKIMNGSSIDCLPKFFEEIGHNNFFLYLDAHWDGNWPILDELRLVAEWGLKPVIIIHDFDNGLGFQYDSCRPFQHLGDETEVFMNFDYVKESIEKIYGENGYIFETNKESTNPIKVGCAYFYPKK
jgi:hypothetical protein